MVIATQEELVAEIAEIIEEATGIDPSAEELASLKTVGDAVAYIQKHAAENVGTAHAILEESAANERD